MAQIRPRKRSVPLRTSEVVDEGTGQSVHVAASAVRDMSYWSVDRTLPAPPEPTAADMLKSLSPREIRRAARNAGRREPSDRTIRRWRQENRIPHDKTADLISRRDLINRIGGPERACRLLGRSRSALNDWMAGRTHQMRADARIALRLAIAGIDPTTQTPYITFTADVMVRMGSKDHYDYRHRKDFYIGVPPPGSGMPGGQDIAKGNVMTRQWIIRFAMAMAANNYAAMVALLEEYVTGNVADFAAFDNTTGFHFEHISKLRVWWS